MSVASLHAHWYLFSLASTTVNVSSASTRLPCHVARCTGLAAHLYPTGCIPRPWCHTQSSNLSKQHYKTELSNLGEGLATTAAFICFLSRSCILSTVSQRASHSCCSAVRLRCCMPC